MTVASTTNKASYNGNGTQSVFAYTFKIFADADIKVYVGTTLKTINTHYTLSGVGATNGGNVTFTSGNIPAAGTGNVTLLRSLALTQGVDLVNYGRFDAEVVEAQYDKLTMMVQQLQEQADRTIRFNTTVSDAGGVEITDTVAERSGKVLAYDANGDLSVANELGDWQGNWATSRTYAVRDLALDAATNNVYTCLVSHTSGTLSSDVAASKWALVINAAAVAASAATATTKASEAAASATTATTQATNSANSATAAASSATTATTQANTATTQASTATTKASEASTSASNSATSASAGATSATNAANSATAGANSATASANSATAAASSASTATTKASEASTSASTATTKASEGATSATNSANSATASANSATASANSATASANSASTASTQATNSSNSATASANSATAAASSASNASSTLSNAIVRDAATGAASMPTGTTAQRPSGAVGMFRHNSTLNKFEGYNDGAWGELGGGGPSLGTDSIVRTNAQVINEDITIPANTNGSTIGDITVNAGKTVTVSSGSTWVII